MTSVLVVDNYDSFTYNLVQYLGELGAEIDVVRNDRATVDELLERAPGRVVVSPGPCTPNEAGISLEVMRRFPEAGVPTRLTSSARRTIPRVKARMIRTRRETAIRIRTIRAMARTTAGRC